MFSAFFGAIAPIEEVGHDSKTFCLQAPSLIFAPYFTLSRDELGKAITHMEKTIAKSEGHCKLFAMLLRLHRNQALKDSSKFKTSH